jgi:hypothetical protein
MKFEVNEKDHSKYVGFKNELRDTERQKTILIKEYEELVERIEGTRDLIQKTTEDSGKERKVLDLQMMIRETKAHSKAIEKETKEREDSARIVFD